jgi:hypothetical protein
LGEFGKQSETYFDVFGLFRELRACNGSVAASGIFSYAGFLIC